MNKVKLLSALLVVLLLINVSLSVMMYRNIQHMRPEGPRREIIEKLHFDAEQVRQYDVLIDKHRSDIRNAQDAIRSLKNNLYAQLKKNDAGNDSDSLITQINHLQKDIEYTHLHHFKDIQQLCKPGQQALFDELTSEIAALFSPQHPKK